MKLNIITKVISTIGSGAIAYSLTESFVGGDETLSIVGGALGVMIGGSAVFFGIPEMLRRNLITMAFVTGLLFTFLWLLNAETIKNIYIKSECSKIEPRFSILEEKYLSKTVVDSVLKDTADFKSKIESLTLSISHKEKEIIEQSKKIKAESKQALIDTKSSDIKAWRNGAYKKIALENGCKTKISFVNLVSCVGNNAVAINRTLENIREEIRLSETKIVEAKGLLSEAETYNSEQSEKSNKSKDELASSKRRIDEVRAEAQKRGDAIELTLQVIMFLVGFFIEVLSIMFHPLLDWIEKSKAKNEKVKAKKEEANENHKEIVEKKEEIHKILEESKTKLAIITHNFINMNFCIAYANDYEDEDEAYKLKYSFRTIQKKGRGKVLAISNAIMGAFLYAYTMQVGKKSLTSWNDLKQQDILFVNGLAERKFVNGVDKNNTIEQFLSPLANSNVTCLGSTATVLSNKAIKEYLLTNGIQTKKIDPQNDAIQYLQMLEEIDKERYAPQQISLEDLKSIAITFVKTYYPDQFI